MSRYPKLPVVQSPAKPCGTCPYSRSTPVGVWYKLEYDNLLAMEHDQIGKVFGCHLGDGTVCRGWLADQKRRDLPSIALRLALCMDKEGKLGEALEAVDENDPDLYDSINEMIEANAEVPFPVTDPKARKLRKLKRRSRR